VPVDPAAPVECRAAPRPASQPHSRRCSLRAMVSHIFRHDVRFISVFQLSENSLFYLIFMDNHSKSLSMEIFTCIARLSKADKTATEV
jgi:hypothetical protein